MSHCFNVIWICSPHRHSRRSCQQIHPYFGLHSWCGCSPGEVKQMGDDRMSHGSDKDMWRDSADSLLHRERVRRHFGQSDSHGLGGEEGRLKGIKEGSGFPHASALFLGYWNDLQEQHKLSNGFTTKHCASWPKVFLMRSGMLVLFPAPEASASSEMY